MSIPGSRLEVCGDIPVSVRACWLLFQQEATAACMKELKPLDPSFPAWGEEYICCDHL